ncbi:MAG: UvrD-helicase domain-containing protein [Rectinema subterraneum]|uniref:UvrD-helicase domain-containing protein n=1 Tax=Rectinema subterraneum TaxID=2653714 RepID=UPI003C7E912A
MQTQYKVYLNHSVTSRFSQMSAAERRRFAEKMRFLAAGIWEGGILVKKLSGSTRKVLFEARLSKGDRLLFTLGKTDGESAVYIWAFVKHDDVSRKARVGIPDNAPFLDFPTDTEETIEGLYLDAVPDQWHTQEGIEEKVIADYGPQKWNVLDDDEWDRLLAAKNISGLDFHLYLSREQYSILERDLPLLVSGTAGSGKTTIALYYLSRKELLGSSRLFVTYSPYLRDEASKLYQSLVKGNTLEDRPPFPDFLTIEELQRRTIDPHSPLQNPATFVGLNEFTELIAAHPLAKNYDPELLWEEIRAIIKGAVPPYSLKRLETLARELAIGSISVRDRQELASELARYSQLSFGGKLDAICAAYTAFPTMEDFANALGTGAQEGELQVVTSIIELLKKKKEFLSRPLLTLEEYEFLGKKRAPNFIYDRQELYALATYYQKKLEEQGLYDEIDLAKRALLERKRMQNPQVWNLVVCDEIQDMTDVHLELLFDLCSSRDHVLFAGDERQTINPSGFRWEAVRSRFFESGARVPDISRLAMNFRSTGAIVELGNALLDLKKTFVGVGKFEARESWKFSGKSPVVIEGIEEARILHIVRQSGTDRSTLVRSPEEKRRLIAHLGTQLVFTIQEAKGLEFDTVLLWKFIEDENSGALWSTMAEGAADGAPEELLPHLSHELNLLYTAIVRARSILTIYDGPKPSAVWNAGRLSSLVIRTSDTTLLEESWSKASTPEEWNRQGELYFARGYYAAAAECYRNAGHHEKEHHARGLVALQAKDYLHAGPLLEQAGEFARAAWCYERSGALTKAMELYARGGDKATQKRPTPSASMERTDRQPNSSNRITSPKTPPKSTSISRIGTKPSISTRASETSTVSLECTSTRAIIPPLSSSGSSSASPNKSSASKGNTKEPSTTRSSPTSTSASNHIGIAFQH